MIPADFFGPAEKKRLISSRPLKPLRPISVGEDKRGGGTVHSRSTPPSPPALTSENGALLLFNKGGHPFYLHLVQRKEISNRYFDAWFWSTCLMAVVILKVPMELVLRRCSKVFGFPVNEQ
ncbi:hypothetical protein CEXT_434451 [Caerostris extrusa]|uniref:Uncharacterized protein n=1 Tax=Caerostris extrusa TaxID=172846 RepID=A0AAV4Q4U3_CAEEX|nr:hypothetical protein CEXT_434451 [Caerostris extrusa]